MVVSAAFWCVGGKDHLLVCCEESVCIGRSSVHGLPWNARKLSPGVDTGGRVRQVLMVTVVVEGMVHSVPGRAVTHHLQEVIVGNGERAQGFHHIVVV